MENLLTAGDRLVEVRYLVRLLPHLQPAMHSACGRATLFRGTADAPPAIVLYHSDRTSDRITFDGDEYVCEFADWELRLPRSAEYRDYMSFARTVSEEL